MKRAEFKMELEVEAKIQEEGTGLCATWVWEKNNKHRFISFVKVWIEREEVV